jgi:YHYH protein
VPRNGSNGTDNLSTNGAARSTLPAWALRLYGDSSAESKTGPDVSSSYPFGRYMEDNAFLGDLTNSATGKPWAQGTDFDLDQYNGRWCVTPDFPNGTYAYFVAIDSDGTPVFPYNIGRAFYGNPTGGSVTTISETVVTNFRGGPNLVPVLGPPAVNGNVVTLSWSAAEGGTYQVQSTTNLPAWQTNTSGVAAILNFGVSTNNGAGTAEFYRVVRTALADYDPVSGSDASGGSAATIAMLPLSGAPGTSFSVTATISADADPPVPPHTGAPVATFTVGSISVTGASYTYNGGSGSVTGTLTIPAGAAPGSQTVTITFSPPPEETAGPSYMQTGAFTIN